MFDWEEELKNLPDQPGVYLMHNSNDEVIYVGKAKILKNRVRQYFRKNSNHTPKVRAMVANVAYFEYIVTDTETEALALECNLIKKYTPKYNILLKDDKHYPYLKVTINEPYPKILKVRKLQRDGAKYYGPYVDGTALKNVIEIIRRLFKPPSCNRRFPEDIKKGRPCLNYHINTCFAPCTGKVSKDEYRQVFFDICRFLDGNHKELIRDLTEQMQTASKNLEYEKAAALRDKIRSINEIDEKQRVINTDKQNDKDVIAITEDDKLTFCEILFVRMGKVTGHKSYKLDNTANSDSAEILNDFVKQFYAQSSDIPDEVLTKYEIADAEIIGEWLRERKGRKVSIISPKRGEKLSLVKMADKNALTSLENYKIKQFKEKEKSAVLDELQSALNLSEYPKRIEAYDISNIQGSDNVGGMAVFENGKSAKRKYRIFKIKSFEGADDYAAMREVIYRRFRHAMEEEEQIANGMLNARDAKFLPLPDLILLDGGRGHLNTVTELLDMMEIDIPMFGMVKDNKHRTRGLVSGDGMIELKQTSPAFKLVTHIQDEVHNTAISYHRKLHSKITSELDNIKGVGEKRRNALLTMFESIDKIKEATVDELENADGMDRKSAQNVYDYFHNSGKE